MPQRPLQRRLHLHVAQLGDSEVEVLDGGGVLLRVVLQHQLGEVETYEGDFGTEAHLLAYFEALPVEFPRCRSKRDTSLEQALLGSGGAAEGLK